MTNKEHLATLSSDEWIQRVEWLYHIYGKGYTQTLLAVKDWLDKKYTTVEPIKIMNKLNDFYFVCPVCYMILAEGNKKCKRCMTDIDWDNVT